MKFFHSIILVGTVLIFAGLISACSNPGVSRADMNESISVRYGTVSAVEQVKLKSDVAKGAVVGGVLGALIGDDKLASAAIGAAAGGLLTKAAEGSDMANSYTVRMADGTETKIVTEAGNVRVGDCVVIEQGGSANIRVTSPVYCKHAGHPALNDPEVTEPAQQEANACHKAKQMALEATTEQAIDLAAKKIRALCEA